MSAGRVTSRRSQMSGVSQVVPTTAPGVPLVPKPPGPCFHCLSSKPGRAQSSWRLRERVVPDGWLVFRGWHDLGDAWGHRRRRPAADFRLVTARPLLPDDGILEHLDEHSADYWPGTHAVAPGVVGHIRVDKRQPGRRLVQVIVNRRHDRIEVSPRLGHGCGPETPVGLGQASARIEWQTVTLEPRLVIGDFVLRDLGGKDIERRAACPRQGCISGSNYSAYQTRCGSDRRRRRLSSSAGRILSQCS